MFQVASRFSKWCTTEYTGRTNFNSSSWTWWPPCTGENSYNVHLVKTQLQHLFYYNPYPLKFVLEKWRSRTLTVPSEGRRHVTDLDYCVGWLDVHFPSTHNDRDSVEDWKVLVGYRHTFIGLLLRFIVDHFSSQQLLLKTTFLSSGPGRYVFDTVSRGCP